MKPNNLLCVYLIATVFNQLPIKAQEINYTNECAHNLFDTSEFQNTNSISIFDDPLNYIPYNTSGDYGLNTQPIKVIDVAFHIFQAADGHGNYQNTSTDIEELKMVLEHLNSHYSSGEPTDPVPGCIQIPDYNTKIQYSLGEVGSERIFFYNNDLCYNTSDYITLQNYVSSNYPDQFNGFYNVYFSEGYYSVVVTKINVKNGGSGYSPDTKVKLTPEIDNHESIVHITNGKIDSITFEKTERKRKHPKNWGAEKPLPVASLINVGDGNGAIIETEVDAGVGGYSSAIGTFSVLCKQNNRWFGNVANLLGHEIGHSFELDHVFESKICNDPLFQGDIFGVEGCPHFSGWDGKPDSLTNDGYCNNLMNYGPHLIYESPVQTGYIHKATSIGGISRFVREVKHDIPLTISNKINIQLEYRAWRPNTLKLFRDIIIEGEGAHFVVDRNLLMPSNSTITVNPGGILEISKFGTVLNHKNQAFNCTILVKNGAKLLLTNNSFLEIGAEGQIIIESGGEIVCSGSSTIRGSGLTILSGNINAAPGATLTLEGNSKNTTLLQVENEVNLSGNLSNFSIKNGKIEMTSSSSELYFENGIDNITLENITLTSSTNSYNAHKGIDIRSDGNVTITNSNFSCGYYGVFSSRSATAPNLVINNSVFSNNYMGLRTYNSGVSIENSTFSNNTNKGIYCYGLDKASSITNCNITGQNSSGAYGLYYYAAANASLYLYANNINSNYYGVCLNGSFVTNAKCNTINNNSNYGININATDLYVANQPGISGGNNQIYANLYAIQANGNGANFYLNDGYNDFRSDSKCMTGTVDGISGGTVLANNNYWKNGGGAPVINTNYLLYGSSTNITLSDGSPESGFSPCSAPGGLKSMLMGETYSYNYRQIETSYSKAPLNQMVELILNTDINKGVVFNDETRFNLLDELFANNLENLNEGEAWYIKHAYNMYKISFAQVELKANTKKSGNTNTNKMVSCLNKLENDNKRNSETTNKFKLKSSKLNIDEAYTLWYNANYDEAIKVIRKLLQKADDQQKCELNKIMCEIEADRAFIESKNVLDIDELLAECNCSENNSRKIGTINNSEISDKTKALTINITPHPVNNISKISVIGLTENAELVIYNNAGKIVKKETISSDTQYFEISNKEYNAGIYLITVNANGKMLKSTKMVITE